MSFTCELSGEPLATSQEPIVATPSGHICIKRLLLQKLTENGGMDPFETIRERPLSEDQLVELQTKSSGQQQSAAVGAPPRPQVTSLPNLLQLMQTEYDALVLELFDTRKALEDTRRELSQALYQNDAAVRVVARLSMERDAARQELERWNASVGANPDAAVATATAGIGDDERAESTGVEAEAGSKDIVAEEGPQSKRRKVAERPSEPLSNDLSEVDMNAMVSTWETLHPQRKPALKAAAAGAPTPDVLGSFQTQETKNWHKSTCRSVIAMARHRDLVVTAGKDKQVVVYSVSEEVVKHTLNLGVIPSCVDILGDVVVVAAAAGKGKVVAFSVEDGSTLGELITDEKVVDVKVHPTQKHICIATSSGTVIIGVLENGSFTKIATFQGSEETTEYTCGDLHPDGLLYAAGTVDGAIHMWDFKNKMLASTMKEGDDDAVTAISFSENGYHLATGHSSAKVKFWDLRKQKTFATMNGSDNGDTSSTPLLKSVVAIAFDDSAKHVAMGGNGGVLITTVKEWGTTCHLVTDKPVSGLGWTKSGILSCSDKERAISFHGAP